jgi:predicted Fe-Mo cluster-binding NifX family protein
MKIGVAATGGSPDAEVVDQFGRCRWFVVVGGAGNRLEC